MIVCICNNLSEDQIEHACGCAEHASEVHKCLNCEPRCEMCIPDIEQIFNKIYNISLEGEPEQAHRNCFENSLNY